jgi:hypothetical protein
MNILQLVKRNLRFERVVQIYLGSIYKASPIQYAKAVCGFETCANNALKTILKLMDDLEAHGQRLRVQKQVTTTIKNGVVTQEMIQNKIST